MSKFSSVKNVKNLISGLDINKLYVLQKYVNNSKEFFDNFDFFVKSYEDNDCTEIEFINCVLSLYYSFKDELGVS